MKCPLVGQRVYVVPDESDKLGDVCNVYTGILYQEEEGLFITPGPVFMKRETMPRWRVYYDQCFPTRFEAEVMCRLGLL